MSFCIYTDWKCRTEGTDTFTDQDNAIIFENCEGEKLKIANEYFLSLGKKINDMLAEAGFRLCKGDNMAGNPKWCQPIRYGKSIFLIGLKIRVPMNF